VLGVRLTGSHRAPPARGASRLRSGSYMTRAEIMSRISAALGPGGAVPDVPRGYHVAGSGPTAGSEEVVARFCKRASEYRATVQRVAPGGLEDAVVEACRAHGAHRLAVPPGAPHHLSGLELVIDDPPISARALDQLDGVLTGCALAIAETGTIVLDGGDRSGRRALTLVPDFHVCLVEADRIHASVPDAIAALAPAAAEGRPLTFVSGPSATSDIELERVEGVHGPRTLAILVLHA
jgi:L-lactate dehydrogenase complex protein LldG